jgi:Dolichyl-phosphate-mannose-protein mannosyltransferase
MTALADTPTDAHTATTERRRTLPPLVTVALILVLLGQMAVTMVTTARQQSATPDEPVYIGAAVVYLREHSLRLNVEHPPLAKQLIAIGMAAGDVRGAPSVTGSRATLDVPCAGFLLTACWMLWRGRERPWRYLPLAGLAVGLALAVKMNALVAVPVVAGLAGFAYLRGRWSRLPMAAVVAAMVVAIAVATVWVSYLTVDPTLQSQSAQRIPQLGPAAPEADASSCVARSQGRPTRPGRHVDLSDRRPATRRPRPETDMAVVFPRRRVTIACGQALASISASLRPRTHLPTVQTDPWLDHCETARPAGGRPMDLADHRRPHPTPADPHPRGRPAPALGTPGPTRSTHSCPRPTRVAGTSGRRPSVPREHRNPPLPDQAVHQEPRTRPPPPVTTSAKQPCETKPSTAANRTQVKDQAKSLVDRCFSCSGIPPGMWTPGYAAICCRVVGSRVRS